MDAEQQPDQGEEPPRKKQRKGASRMKLQRKPVPVAGGAAGGARQGAPEPVSAAAAYSYVPDGELRAALRQLVTPATVATLSLRQVMQELRTTYGEGVRERKAWVSEEVTQLVQSLPRVPSPHEGAVRFTRGAGSDAALSECSDTDLVKDANFVDMRATVAKLDFDEDSAGREDAASSMHLSDDEDLESPVQTAGQDASPRGASWLSQPPPAAPQPLPARPDSAFQDLSGGPGGQWVNGEWQSSVPVAVAAVPSDALPPATSYGVPTASGRRPGVPAAGSLLQSCVVCGQTFHQKWAWAHSCKKPSRSAPAAAASRTPTAQAQASSRMLSPLKCPSVAANTATNTATSGPADSSTNEPAAAASSAAAARPKKVPEWATEANLQSELHGQTDRYAHCLRPYAFWPSVA